MALLGYKVYADAATAQAQADALWTRYSTRERTARGLPGGASLDTRAGARVAAITVRYTRPYRAGGETRAALAIDDFALAQHGQLVSGTTIDTTAPVAFAALPPLLQAAVRTP